MSVCVVVRNGAGDPLTATDPLSHTTTSTFNAHHKLLTKTLPGVKSVNESG